MQGRLCRAPRLVGPSLLLCLCACVTRCFGVDSGFLQPPIGPTEEAEPYESDSRWGRAVRQRWEDKVVFGAYLREQVQLVSGLPFWTQSFIECLPQKPEKERQRQERNIKRRADRLKLDREKKEKGQQARRHRSTPKLSTTDEWLKTYREDPFMGFDKLPLQLLSGQSAKGPGSCSPVAVLEQRENVLLLQLEEENTLGAFKLRFLHLKALLSAIRKRVFTGVAPQGPLTDPQQGAPAYKLAGAGARGGGDPQGPSRLPNVDVNAIRMVWVEKALKTYLPALQQEPQGADAGRQFLEELAGAFDALDREKMLRAPSEARDPMAGPENSLANTQKQAEAAAAALDAGRT